MAHPRKPDDERSGRQPRVHPTKTLMWDGEVRGPLLEDELPDVNWSPRTKKLWETIRHSAQAMLFHDSDWDFLIDTAYLHNLAFVPNKRVTPKGDVVEVEPALSEVKSAFGEVRTRLMSYGFTVASRNQLGMNIVTAEEVANEATSETAKAAVDYKSMLGGH